MRENIVGSAFTRLRQFMREWGFKIDYEVAGFLLDR